MADKVLPGYPVPIGGRQDWVLQHAGPKSYVQGGETFNIVSINGGGVIDIADVSGLSFNSAATGTYFLRVLYPIGQGVAGSSGSLSVVLQWFVQATGLEVAGAVDLSAEFVRLRVRGG